MSWQLSPFSVSVATCLLPPSGKEEGKGVTQQAIPRPAVLVDSYRCTLI